MSFSSKEISIYREIGSDRWMRLLVFYQYLSLNLNRCIMPSSFLRSIHKSSSLSCVRLIFVERSRRVHVSIEVHFISIVRTPEMNDLD